MQCPIAEHPPCWRNRVYMGRARSFAGHTVLVLSRKITTYWFLRDLNLHVPLFIPARTSQYLLHMSFCPTSECPSDLTSVLPSKKFSNLVFWTSKYNYPHFYLSFVSQKTADEDCYVHVYWVCVCVRAHVCIGVSKIFLNNGWPFPMYISVLLYHLKLFKWAGKKS